SVVAPPSTEKYARGSGPKVNRRLPALTKRNRSSPGNRSKPTWESVLVRRPMASPVSCRIMSTPPAASSCGSTTRTEPAPATPRAPSGAPERLPDAGADIEVVLADVADGQIGDEEVGLAGSEKSTPQYLIRQSKRFCKVRNPKTRPGRWLAWVAIGCWYESKT